MPFIVQFVLSKVFPAIWSSLTKYWKIYVVILIMLLQGLTACGWYKEHKAVTAEKLALQSEITSVKDAQAAADKLAQDEKIKLQKDNQAKANAAVQNYSTLLTKYNASLMRYSATHIPSSPEQSSNSKPDDSTEGGTGPSGDSQFLTIKLEDAKICATNTARLVAVHDWAVGLKDATP